MTNFDVFLAHNSSDKKAVERLAKRLRDECKLSVWFDKWMLRPGLSWQKEMEEGICSSKAGAVLIGKDGLGPWEDEEMQVLLQFAIRKRLPVIPILMPGAPLQPELPVFLANRHYVDLRNGLKKDTVAQLLWGITGKQLGVAGRVIPFVIHPTSKPHPLRPLLQVLEREYTTGELEHSMIAPIVIAALKTVNHLELEKHFDPNWIVRGIQLSDEYFVRVHGSAGQRDWQRDFPQTATPILVCISRSLRRSADAHALIIQLCEALAARLRLVLVWPEIPDELNDIRNCIYAACIKSTHLEDDDVLVALKGLSVVGPK